MRKIVFPILLFLLFNIWYFTASILFSDYNKIYKDFIGLAKLSQDTTNKIEYELYKFPAPTLVIKEINEEGKIYLKNIKIGFSFISILKFAPKINDLNIDQVKFHLVNNDVNLINHDQFIAELINKEALDVQARVGRLEFVESDNDIPIVIENFFFDGIGTDTRFSGIVDNIGSIEGSFKYPEADLMQFSLNINGDGLKVSIDESYRNSILKDGKVNIKTSNLAGRLAKMMPDISQIISQVNSPEEVNLSFDILQENDIGYYKNIKIQSNSIEGSGELSFNKNGPGESKINLVFSKFDLNSLKNSKIDNDSSQLSFGSTGSKFDFSKNKLDATVFVEKIQLSAANTLNKVTLNAGIEDGKFLIREFNGAIDEVGNFKIAGSISQNSFRSIFEGNIAISHSDLNDLAEFLTDTSYRTDKPIPYAFTSEVKLSTVGLTLQNMLLRTTDSDVSGQVAVKFIGNTPRVISSIKFTNLDVDNKNFPIVSQIFDFATSLTKGTKEDSYVNKFIPVRKINAMSNLAVEINKLNLNNQQYSNVDFTLHLAPARITISDLKLVNGNDFIDFSIDLQAQGIKPIATITVNDGSFGINFLSPAALLELRQKVLNEASMDKIDLIMKCYFTKLYQNNINLDRVAFEARTKGKLIEISKFDSNLFKGRMQSSGSVLLDPFTINFVYALNSASITEIKNLIPSGYINSDGVISAGGMWATNGNNLNELLYNLYTKSNILAKSLSIENISIDELIEKANTADYKLKMLENDIKQALLTGKTNINELSTDVEMSKGTINMPSLKFKTKTAIGTATVVMNIYDFSINLNSVLAYSVIADPSSRKSYTDFTPVKVNLNASGNIFTPKKEADLKELEKVISNREKAVKK